MGSQVEESEHWVSPTLPIVILSAGAGHVPVRKAHDLAGASGFLTPERLHACRSRVERRDAILLLALRRMTVCDTIIERTLLGCRSQVFAQQGRSRQQATNV